MNLQPRFSRDAILTTTQRGWLLAIPAGLKNRYRLAQLDDHKGIARRSYPWRPPITLKLRARISSPTVPGTWGFGLWNDPFGFSFGPGEQFLRLPALPNAAWFFFGSQRNYLSFRDEKPANGFLAQVFRSPPFHPQLVRSILALPFSRKTARRLLSRIIDEDAVRLDGRTDQSDWFQGTLSTTTWHTYRLEWQQSQTKFWVDEKLALTSRVSPCPPLGLVIWIDNQYAAFTPRGDLNWGLEENSERAWLEIEDLELSNL
jgi:hypothetical protein